MQELFVEEAISWYSIYGNQYAHCIEPETVPLLVNAVQPVNPNPVPPEWPKWPATWVCIGRLQHLRLSLRRGPVSPDTGGPCQTSWKFPPPLLLVLSSVTGQVLSPMLALLQLQPATRFDPLFCPFSTQPMACRPAPRTTPLPCPVSGPADGSVPMPCLLVSQPPELSSMFPYSDALFCFVPSALPSTLTGQVGVLNFGVGVRVVEWLSLGIFNSCFILYYVFCIFGYL